MESETARARPTGLVRLLYKVPALLYRAGLSGQLGSRMLLLTTTGRKSGRQRVTALNYAQDGATVYVLVGYGPLSDWYRNLMANPSVEVQIGRRRYVARARQVAALAETERAVKLVKESNHGPPRAIRPILKRLAGLDYDAEAERAFAHPESILAIALEPVAD